ncbi:hypothetical protein [Leucobacter iarius]|uniref:Lipoprotein n=1 Tax=Leucobacter iarius TaxID=333963 RepID=A0ABP4XDU6_9MICO
MAAPESHRRPPRSATRTAALLGGIALALAASLTACFPLQLPPKPAPSTSAAPESSRPSESKPSPNDSEPDDSQDDDERVFGPEDPEIDGSGPVAPRLEALGDRYRQMHDDGSLWKKIPQTKENEGAYLAFQIILTDMRSATRFGVDDATQTQYAKRAKHAETLLLAQKPLGTSVKYTLKDGRTFRYDGDTGEVGLD